MSAYILYGFIAVPRKIFCSIIPKCKKDNKCYDKFFGELLDFFKKKKTCNL